LSTVYIHFPMPPGDPSERDAQRAAAPARAPLLERLLARADPSRVDDWRLEAFRALAEGPEAPPAVGAAVLAAALGAEQSAAAGACAFVATPLHCVATMTSVRLPSGGLLRLEPSEADELAADFNRVFDSGGQRLIAADGSLTCVFEREVAATAKDPQQVVGRDIHEFLPSGADGAMLRRFMSEIEMWLFEHRLNRRRIATGALPITSLWLWGGGPTVSRLPTLRGAIAGADPLFAAWPALSVRPSSDSKTICGSTVIIVAQPPGTEVWQDAQAAWIVPALARLRAGSIESLDLSAGERRYRVSAGWRWRLWRRTRPWWEYFE